MEKMPWVLTSLEKRPTPPQCWPEWKHWVLSGLLWREEASETWCKPQTVAGLASFTQGTGRTLPLISSQVISLEDNYFGLKMALSLEPRLRNRTVQLGQKMFLESCGLLQKFAFQSVLLLVRTGKSEKSTWAKELSPEGAKKPFSVSCGESQEPSCGRLLGLPPNSWFRLDFCVINRHLPVPLPHVSSKPLLPYKGNPL